MAEHLDAIVAARVAWIATLSEEQKAALAAEQGFDHTEELTQTFNMADTNNDEHLDTNEFKVFFEYMVGNMNARGTPTMPLADYNWDQMYAFFNHASPDDGVSIADIKTAHGLI